MDSKIATLKKYFGFDSFRYGQKEVIDNILNNDSAAAIFPTGAGKSMCYQLPALILPGLTLVVSPLLSLMKDQLDFLLSCNVPAARLDSTLSREEYARILEKAKSGKIKILMISVERFKNERFRYHLERMNISLLAIDEAHCISEWGHNFRPEYLKLPDYKKEFDIPQVLLLTATATPQVIKDIRDKFQIPEKNVTVTGFYRENLFLQVSSISESDKKNHLFNGISKKPQIPTIVYVTQQKTAEDVAEFLSSKGVVASPYHAGMGNDLRESVQNSFIGGKLNCIVATIAFGMGIDKKDIRRIFHYDLPKTIENYSQEIGRSGRDGENSFCEVLANRDNINVLENFVYGDTPEIEGIFELLKLIKENDSSNLEIKPLSLSKTLDIRALPFKTLLVYLDMNSIIKPKYTYFDEYSFKYRIEPEEITGKFQGERQNFVQALFKSCDRKKVWCYLNIEKMDETYRSDRKRVITALEYFNEKEWIELSAKQSVDVYNILNKDFDLDSTAAKVHELFAHNETREIERIHNMIGFFEVKSCMSRRLANYFGENIEKEMCGHCSFCTTGEAALLTQEELAPLNNNNAGELIKKIDEQTGGVLSKRNVAKLLCGILTPAFSRLKVRGMNEFGLLEKYPFKEVNSWICGDV